MRGTSVVPAVLVVAIGCVVCWVITIIFWFGDASAQDPEEQYFEIPLAAIETSCTEVFLSAKDIGDLQVAGALPVIGEGGEEALAVNGRLLRILIDRPLPEKRVITPEFLGDDEVLLLVWEDGWGGDDFTSSRPDLLLLGAKKGLCRFKDKGLEQTVRRRLGLVVGEETASGLPPPL